MARASCPTSQATRGADRRVRGTTASEARASSLIVLIGILMLSVTKYACPATLRVLSGDAQAFTLPSKCNFRLDGEIHSGDLAQVASARAQVQKLISERLAVNWSMASQWAGGSPVLCLNSRGGNFIEGLRIAKYLMTVAADHEVTTYVENNAAD